MKKILFLTIFLTLFFVAQDSAWAQKIAFVDVGKVFDGYQKTKEFDTNLTGEGKEKQNERDALVQEIRRLKDEQALLSDNAKQEKQSLIDGKIRDLQEFDDSVRRDLGGRRDTAIKEIFKDIDGVIKTYGKQKGYDYILNQRLALYSRGEYDITQQVMDQINKEYKKK